MPSRRCWIFANISWIEGKRRLGKEYNAACRFLIKPVLDSCVDPLTSCPISHRSASNLSSLRCTLCDALSSLVQPREPHIGCLLPSSDVILLVSPLPSWLVVARSVPESLDGWISLLSSWFSDRYGFQSCFRGLPSRVDAGKMYVWKREFQELRWPPLCQTLSWVVAEKYYGRSVAAFYPAFVFVDLIFLFGHRLW